MLNYSEETIFTPNDVSLIRCVEDVYTMTAARVGIASELKESVRKTDLIRIDPNNATFWIFHHLLKRVKYRYDLPFLQYAIYRVGGKYDWHRDAIKGERRRLSVSVQLSHPGEYSGGNLELLTWFGRRRMAGKGIGNAVFFGPQLLHRVKPVTAGVRLSLVGWFLKK